MIPVDLEAGKRHDLAQISVMDEHARMNERRRLIYQTGPLRSTQACASRFARARFVVAPKGLHAGDTANANAVGTVVEQRLSEQWFVKIEPLADRAINAVESGEITIVPENYPGASA